MDRHFSPANLSDGKRALAGVIDITVHAETPFKER